MKTDRDTILIMSNLHNSSIEPLLGGHNFTSGEGGVTVVALDTAKTVLVPAEMYEEGVGEEYLVFNGMEPGEGEVAVASEPMEVSGVHGGGIVAVMAVRSDVLELVGGDFRVTSPLLIIASGAGRERRKREVNIFLTDDNAYLAVWEKGEGGLRMAEVLPDTSMDSLLYYMQVVGRSFKLRRFDINIGGERAGMVADTLRRYFKNVKTASFGL